MFQANTPRSSTCVVCCRGMSRNLSIAGPARESTECNAPAFRATINHDRRIDMNLINLVVVLVVIGVILWLINNYIPMDGTIKKILNVVVVIFVVLWLLSAFGLLGSMSGIRIG
jgi:hypothetical protein